MKVLRQLLPNQTFKKLCLNTRVGAYSVTLLQVPKYICSVPVQCGLQTRSLCDRMQKKQPENQA